MIRTLVTAVFSLLGGLALWFCYNFIGRSITQFHEIRSETQMSFSSASATDAARCYRGLGSRLEALQATALNPVLWFLKRRGYSLKAAAGGLLDLSNNLAPDHQDDAAECRVKVQQALRLPVDAEDHQRVADMRLLKSITVTEYFQEQRE
jgi:hypothetical protein